MRGGLRKVLGNNLSTPPCNIGPRSTPNYADLANAAITKVGDGIAVFAGQRLDGFYVDLGSVFDLAVLRPFQNLHAIPTPAVPGVNALRAFNVHTIAIQVPITQLTRNSYRPSDVLDARSVIGVWASAHRQKGHYRDENREQWTGPFTQVSRLANPLFNEVIVPMSQKDGIPQGLIPGFQNYTGKIQADLLRLNVAIPPSPSPHINGILGGDLAGFPNGRRVFDNVVAIELRAVAGATYPLVDPTYVPDGASGVLTDLTDGPNPPDTVSYLTTFPYLDHPVSGDRIVPLSVPA